MNLNRFNLPLSLLRKSKQSNRQNEKIGLEDTRQKNFLVFFQSKRRETKKIIYFF